MQKSPLRILVDGCLDQLRFMISVSDSLIESDALREHDFTFDIENSLRSLNISYKDIDEVCVSVGPGSFTGIKISLAWAQGLKAALPGIHLRTFSSLQAIGLYLNETESISWVALPATRTQGAIWSVRDSDSIFGCSALHLESESQESFIRGNLDLGEAGVVLGSWEKLQETLKNESFQNRQIAEVAPPALKSFLKKLSMTPAPSDVPQMQWLKPLYLRLSTAEQQSVNKNHSIS